MDRRDAHGHHGSLLRSFDGDVLPPGLELAIFVGFSQEATLLVGGQLTRSLRAR